MQSVIPDPTNVILISGDILNPNFYPKHLVDGIVDRASWFALMESIESRKGIAGVMQTCCICCNARRIIMQGACSNINADFYGKRPIYSWTKDDNLSVNSKLLKTDVEEREIASHKKRNSVISK